MMDTGFLESLSRMRLALRQNSTMNMSGNRKSSQKGTSTEFSGFREYIPGDDLRRIDWNAYGRLNKLYIKEYMEEKETAIKILIDTSASMNYGSVSKAQLCQKLALSFSYMAINNMDRVILYDLKHPDKPFECQGGKKGLPSLVDWIDKLQFEGDLSLTDCVMKLPLKNNGITILISDFLEECFLNDSAALNKILRYLRYKKQQIILLHTLSANELRVDMTGTLNLIDMESKNKLRVTMENRSILEYEKTLHWFLSMMEQESNRNGVNYCLCDSGMEFKKIIFEKLRFAYDI